MLVDERPRFSRLRVLAYIVAGAVLYSIPFTLKKFDVASWGGDSLKSLENTAEVELQEEFNWDHLLPSHKLNWKDCYPGRQCTRLIAPLNYSEPEGDIAVIALVRKPAETPPDSKDYRGPVLFNPGGPGGSGVGMIIERGDAFSAILGPQFDIVGFDPRGVSRSTPKVRFFETDAERSLWQGSDREVVNTTAQLTERWARAKIEGQLAKERDETGYLRHINTDHTARDMLHIVRAHGREKIQYWGFSYGTVLGATFASMFPDNVERLIIDGVVDSENYFATLWSNNLIDADKAYKSFFETCSNAGPDHCPFYAPTPKDVAQNLTKILNSIHKTPVPVRTETSYGLLDYERLRSTVFMSLYKPYASFPLLAQGLADFVAGNATTLYKIGEQPSFQCSCGSSPRVVPYVDSDASIAIRCNDGEKVPGSLEHSVDHYNMMTKMSQWGEIWAIGRVFCSGWPDYPKTHFQGPFIGNTSHPVLLIGNTADPVTPLWAAKKMSRGFKDSVVLTQDSPGHCSLVAPSVCTQKYVREYFQDGTLPKPGTVCPVDEEIFSSTQGSIHSSQTQLSEGRSELDNSLLQAIRSISLSYNIPAGPLAVPW
ncbi:TAP-like protein-domain-containing protein [Cyathus striatus]|nr:TAP-like protein-domain-containing protein [Cyathus striatus]